MSNKYVVNNLPQLNGDHEVHKEGCSYFPTNCTDLGVYSSCHLAVASAKSTYAKANGCYYCCNDCHTS